MASENSEMRITKKHLNEATISLHQGSLNESSGLHDCSHNRAPDENVSPLSTPYSAQRRFGKLPANCRTPILYYIDYVSHSSTPYSAQRRFGMLPADYRTPKPVSFYIDYVPSPLTPTTRRNLFDEGVSNIEGESVPMDPIPNEPSDELLSPMSPLTLSLENSDRSNNYEPSEFLMAGVGSFGTSTPASSAPFIPGFTPPSPIAPIMSDSPSPIAHTSISLEKMRRISLVDKVRNMKLPALRSMAKERGLKRYSKLKKADLVALLLEGGDDVDPIPNESLETLLHAHSPLPSLLSPMSPLTLSLENSDRSNNYEPSELLMADVDSPAPFIPVLSTPPSPIAHFEQTSIRCTIEEHIKSSLDAFINDADVCDGEETAVILKQMLSCAETLKYLANRLKGNAGKLYTPVGLLQSPLSEGGSKNDFHQQVTDLVESAEGSEIDLREQVSAPINIEVRVKGKKPEMSNEELRCYLENHVTDEHCYKALMCTTIDKVGNDLEGIAKQLKDTNNRVDGSMLQIYYIFGTQLYTAKEKFDKLKLTEGVTEKWGEWVKKNVGISQSHCCKIRAVAALMKKFPKLQNLKGISFTQLYNLRKKIGELFTDTDIAKKWSKKQIYEDELCRNCNDRPFEPSFFVPCGHGVDYCEACMATLMKDSERTEECIVDGETVHVPVVIPGCICPECRGKINRVAYNRPTIIGAQVQRTVYLRPSRQ